MDKYEWNPVKCQFQMHIPIAQVAKKIKDWIFKTLVQHTYFFLPSSWTSAVAYKYSTSTCSRMTPCPTYINLLCGGLQHMYGM